MTMYINGFIPEKRIINEKEEAVAQQAVKLAHKEAFSRFNAKNDAAAVQYGTLIAREATYYMPKLWFKKYPEVKFREVMPILSQGGFSNIESLKMYDRQGRAKLASENTTVTPTVSSNVIEQTIRFYEYHLEMDWKFSEMQTMEQFQPFNIQAKMNALHKGFELAINDLVLLGDKSINKTGLLNDPTIHRMMAPPITGGATRWSAKEPAEIMSDIRLAYTEMNRRSKGVFNPDTLYISNEAYLLMVGNLRNAVSDLTVLEYAARFLPGLKRIIPDAFLDGQGANDPLAPNLPTNIAVFMNTDESNFFVNNSVEMLPTPAVYSSYLLELPYLARTSGFVLNVSPALLILEGI